MSTSLSRLRSSVSRRLPEGRRGRLLALLALAAVAALVDGFWIEPRLLLGRDRFEVDLVPGRFRVVHLSDLHLRAERGLYERLLRRVAAEEPDLVLVSGDLVADAPDADRLVRRAGEAAQWVSRLRPVAPVLAVPGHSEYLGEVISVLADGGVEWLSNEGRLIGPGGPGGRILLLGLDQQVGRNAGEVPPPVFSLADAGGGATALVARSEKRHNRYLSYDPRQPAERSPGPAADPFSWSGYDASVSLRIEEPASGAGLAVHSRYALGENRAIRLARAEGFPGDSGHFALTFDGSAPETAGGESRLDTGLSPEPGRWYRLRLRTEVFPDRLEVRGRVWPEGEEEPAEWQAWAVDRSARRVERGTVALWTWGEGTTLYRDLRVTDGGRTLLGAPFDERAAEAGTALPRGFRDGARDTRLAMALARSPRVPPGTPRVVLTHSPDPVAEAARRGARLVLAGHTHGGQVRLPLFGALLTRSEIGRRYDRGLFDWPDAPRGAPSGAPSGPGTLLYVNAGVGTSILPVRFFDPPTYAVFDF